MRRSMTGSTFERTSSGIRPIRMCLCGPIHYAARRLKDACIRQCQAGVGRIGMTEDMPNLPGLRACRPHVPTRCAAASRTCRDYGTLSLALRHSPGLLDGGSLCLGLAGCCRCVKMRLMRLKLRCVDVSWQVARHGLLPNNTAFPSRVPGSLGSNRICPSPLAMTLRTPPRPIANPALFPTRASIEQAR